MSKRITERKRFTTRASVLNEKTKTFGSSKINKNSTQSNILKLNEISEENQERMTSGIKEWDQVIGGGILPGSFMILTGDPGIGKSTLLLQIADKIAHYHNVIYFSTEESLEQLKTRAIRLGLTTTKLLFSDESNL